MLSPGAAAGRAFCAGGDIRWLYDQVLILVMPIRLCSYVYFEGYFSPWTTVRPDGFFPGWFVHFILSICMLLGLKALLRVHSEPSHWNLHKASGAYSGPSLFHGTDDHLDAYAFRLRGWMA